MNNNKHPQRIAVVALAVCCLLAPACATSRVYNRQHRQELRQERPGLALLPSQEVPVNKKHRRTAIESRTGIEIVRLTF